MKKELLTAFCCIHQWKWSHTNSCFDWNVVVNIISLHSVHASDVSIHLKRWIVLNTAIDVIVASRGLYVCMRACACENIQPKQYVYWHFNVDICITHHVLSGEREKNTQLFKHESCTIYMHSLQSRYGEKISMLQKHKTKRQS